MLSVKNTKFCTFDGEDLSRFITYCMRKAIGEQIGLLKIERDSLDHERARQFYLIQLTPFTIAGIDVLIGRDYYSMQPELIYVYLTFCANGVIEDNAIKWIDESLDLETVEIRCIHEAKKGLKK